MATNTKAKKRLTTQVKDLKAKYPEAHTTWGRGLLVWTGHIQPTAISEIYTVSISWDGQKARPVVHVLSPKLEDRPDEPIPHVFRNGALCLHYRWEWHTRMNIADTIIPWTSEWLYHYEMWHVTGEWLGGGHVATAEPSESHAA